MRFEFPKWLRKFINHNFPFPARRPSLRRRLLRLEQLEARLTPSVTWTGSINSDWDTPGNWSTNSLPDPGDDVVIELAGASVVHSGSVTDQIHSLTVAASSVSLTLSGGTLNVLNSFQWISPAIAFRFKEACSRTPR